MIIDEILKQIAKEKILKCLSIDEYFLLLKKHNLHVKKHTTVCLIWEFVDIHLVNFYYQLN